MILAAGLLVLLGLGLFVGGVLTGVTGLYWGCVAACLVAAVLLVVARRRIPGAAPARAPMLRVHTPTTGAESAGDGPSAPGEGSGDEGAGATDAPTADAPTADAPPEAGAPELPDPPVEDVEVTDLLLVVDLKDEVLVVDEHPRYHLAGCAHLAGRTTIPLPVDEARTDGFTPCAVCEPDRNLAARARARKHARDS